MHKSVDTAENEPFKITDSAAGETANLVVSRLLKAYLLGKGAASSSQKSQIVKLSEKSKKEKT